MMTRYTLLLSLLPLIFSCSNKKQQELNETSEGYSIPSTGEKDLNLEALQLPDGFQVEVFARVTDARSIAMSPSGILYVGNRRNGDRVYALKDEDGDFKADKMWVLAEGLRMPNGVAFKDGDLYVAEVSKLWRLPDIEKNLADPKKELVYDDYPTDGHHGWKYIAFGPDDKLYIPVGAPCNICESKNEIYASITRMDPDGSNREIVAQGVRNTVGFTWHPETKNLYFTDNGRDMMGDNIPPCELNRVTEAGQHFGYPYWHGGDIKDPEFGDKYPQEDFEKPVQNLGPHVAPLGVKFYTGNMFPEEYRGLAFIAEHGSWNRTEEAGHTGHRVTTVKVEGGEGVSYEPFITGFLNEETNEAWGRPVDLIFLEDGSMLLSDDKGGAIYRIHYTPD